MYKVVSVKPTDDYKLLVTFDNGIVKEYDMKPKLNEWQFELLKSKAFFKAVKVDPGGYGVSWNSEMDLSEYELWKMVKKLTTV